MSQNGTQLTAEHIVFRGPHRYSEDDLQELREQVLEIAEVLVSDAQPYGIELPRDLGVNPSDERKIAVEFDPLLEPQCIIPIDNDDIDSMSRRDEISVNNTVAFMETYMGSRYTK